MKVELYDQNTKVRGIVRKSTGNSSRLFRIPNSRDYRPFATERVGLTIDGK